MDREQAERLIKQVRDIGRSLFWIACTLFAWYVMYCFENRVK